jgi:hypothetical protein
MTFIDWLIYAFAVYGLACFVSAVLTVIRRRHWRQHRSGYLPRHGG